MRRVLYVAICMVVSAAGFAFTSERSGRRPEVSGSSASRSSSRSRTHRNGNAARKLVGYRYDPFCQSKTAVLLLHGLSYTKEAWDFPGYSVAQEIAKAGYAVFAFDRLGYGESKLENGYMVTHEAMAGQANQVIQQLREQGFEHVVLGGHSAGAGATEFLAGVFGGVDAIMASGLASPAVEPARPGLLHRRHAPGPAGRLRVLPRHARSIGPRCSTSPTPTRRWWRPTPRPPCPRPAGRSSPSTSSRRVSSSAGSLCRSSSSSAAKDRLFELEYAKMHAGEFRSSPSVTVDVVPGAGHTFMLTEGRPGRHRADGRLAPVAARGAVLPRSLLVLRGAALPQGDDRARRPCRRNTAASSRWVIFSSFRTGESGGDGRSRCPAGRRGGPRRT